VKDVELDFSAFFEAATRLSDNKSLIWILDDEVSERNRQLLLFEEDIGPGIIGSMYGVRIIKTEGSNTISLGTKYNTEDIWTRIAAE